MSCVAPGHYACPSCFITIIVLLILVEVLINKDHQRMMVDPMVLIIWSLWSFLTAVTTTAVAPIAVILTVFT